MSDKPYTAEYGSELYKNNESVHSVLACGIYTNPHGCEFPATFYHKTAGYTPAGSCARWTNEVWGYSIYSDGASHGKMWSNKTEAAQYWYNLNIRSTIGE